MRVVIDESIPGGRAAFAPLGDVITLPGREIDTEDVSRAGALIVRSVTRVDRPLLGGSQVRFVGTATSGHDHVDRAWLDERGIGFAYAPGCNATAVADWVLASLAALHANGRHVLGRGRAGVIGAGQVGARVARRLAAIGYEVRICDPPRAESEGAEGFVDLAEALACDVVTLHVPLTTGAHATGNLVDAAGIARIPAGGVLLNAARGGVLDEDALATRLDDGPELAAVIDTWCDEPAIDTGLLTRVDIGTPHIAGHSIEGRLRGTAIIARAAGACFGVPVDWDWHASLPPAPALTVHEDLAATVLGAYDPRDHDASLRRLLRARPVDRRAAFDEIRRECQQRREFGFFTVEGAAAGAAAAGLGVADPADGGL